MEKVFDIQSIDEVAYDLVKNAQTKTILFNGDMGAGKTTLISALVKVLGGTTEVSSPTFSIVNEYQVKNDKVYHFDFYRINDVHEALDIGIEDYFYSDHWIFIEWPDKIEEILPKRADVSYIKLNKDGTRTIKLNVSED
ncbi:tRNA (adenosine(37)-N6)-threonylcarbamoyltransferase complex ATPase subunit type 1 TsaE [Flavobacteriaceae sp. LMIT009]